jgi:site-specific DNA-cytosine methylase
VDTFGAAQHRTLQARDWKVGVNNQDINAMAGGDAFLVSQPILSFPSRFGSNANVTEGQAQSIAHSAGAPAVYRKSARAQHANDSETCVEGEVANTLNAFETTDVRTTHAILGGTPEEDNLLPIGLDSHRYRLCGNGVVAPVAEWIGRRLIEADRRWRQEEVK